jgi:PilZ domain
MYVHDTNLEHYIQEQLASNILPVGNPIDTTQPNNPPGAEKRREPRFVMNDPAFLHSLNRLTLDLTPVQVLDVSRQGLKLRIERQILTGSEIQVKLKDLFVLGEIRYCIQVGKVFLAGILVRDVLRFPHAN